MWSGREHYQKDCIEDENLGPARHNLVLLGLKLKLKLKLKLRLKLRLSNGKARVRLTQLSASGHLYSRGVKW